MYVSGTFDTLERRIHEFCEDSSDYASYLSEANSYTGAEPYLINKWHREFAKKGFETFQYYSG